MVTLLASIAGFISSIIPELFKFFTDKNDKKHELEILDRQISIQQSGIQSRLEEVSNQIDIAEVKTIYSTFKSGVHWVDVLNVLVRPILAYSFFALYCTIKYLQFSTITIITDYKALVEALWTIDDQAIFAGIIGFYFGQRAMTKRYHHGKK